MKYSIEPSQVFLDRYRLLPKQYARNVDGKVAELQCDPRPIGKTKTAIVGTRNPKRYRLRVGDYRVIYSFEGENVRIWDVNKRSEVYGRMTAGKFVPVPKGEISPDATDVEVLEESETGMDWAVYRDQLRAWLSPHAGPKTAEEITTAVQDVVPTPLPRRITHDLLRTIRIPRKYHVSLAACRTDVDLVEAITKHGIPGDTVDRVFNVAAEPDDTTLTEQPLWRIRDVEDLTRFYTGDLVDLQRALDPEQKEIAASIARSDGSWLLRGGPGTGKSTILLEAAVDLYQESRKRGEHPKVLVTTYTNALVATLDAQLDRILPGPRPGFDICTADSIVLSILEEATIRDSLSLKLNSSLLRLLQTVTKETLASKGKAGSVQGKRKRSTITTGNTIPYKPLTGMSWQYLLDEIELVIVGRNIRKRDEYLTEPRHGRRLGLTEARRRTVWTISEAFEKELTRRKWTSWARRRRLAADLLERSTAKRRYDAVFVDEAQDLQPNAIRMLVEIASVPKDGVQRLLIAADMNQTIYGTGISWRSMHTELRIRGRSRTLRTNHRSTRQVMVAAEAYLSGSELEEEKSTMEHLHCGPVPEAVLGIAVESEVDRIVEFFQAHCGQIERDVDMCAVLAPTYERCKSIEAEFAKRDIPARFMKRGKVDTLFPGVKIVTRHAAKGLEFPIVALSLVSGAPLIEGDGDEALETRQKERRVNHMAMTRAMRSLLVTLPEDAKPDLVAGITEPLWHVERHIDNPTV